MDTTKLIEEAETLCAVASAAPWRCEHGRGRFEIKSGAVSLAGVLYEQDRDFIVRARTLVPALAAALKASEEQNKATTISLRCAEANLKAAIAETEPVKSANLAANKRIVELEHERDEARRRAQENAEHALDIARDRDAARAELARLTTPLASAELAQIEREHATVAASFDRDGVSPKDSAEAHRNRGVLLAELRRLTTPRPIAEAPRDGTWVMLPFSTSKWDACRGPSPQYVTARWFAAAWADPNGALLTEPSHYLPLPEVKP